MNENVFYVNAFYNGSLNGFEVIPNNNTFSVARDGDIIATLQHNGHWIQTSGDVLPTEVIESIGQQIENRQS